MRKIYLASSWRNENQPGLVSLLRDRGHEVYDFRHPSEVDEGFAWSEIDEDWLNWTPAAFLGKLTTHPRAASGYAFDKKALDWCDTCVLLLPCGRSAHLEAGYAIGQGKRTVIVLSERGFEPELMYLMATACVAELPDLLAAIEAGE